MADPTQVDYRATPSFGGDIAQGHVDRDHPYPAPWTAVAPPKNEANNPVIVETNHELEDPTIQGWSNG